MDETENVEDTEVSETTSEIGEDAEASKTTQRCPTLLNPEVEEGAEAETVGKLETNQRQPTLVLSSEVGEDAEASKTTKRRQALLNPEASESTESRPTLLNPEVVEDAESETTKRKTTPEIGEDFEASETAKRRRTLLKQEVGQVAETSKITLRQPPLLNPEVGEDAEASETSQRRPALLLSAVDRDAYDTIPLAFPAPVMYRALEKYLPEDVRSKSEQGKATYVDEILMRYTPSQKEMDLREYRNKITSAYPRLHEILYEMNAQEFFVPSFIKAIDEQTEDSLRNIISEPSPGILTFEIFQPKYCEMLLAEVNHFQTWIHRADIRTEHRNTMNNTTYLDDFGMEDMLLELMEHFISPISKVFFTEVGGSTIDHHECVVECHTVSENELAVQVEDAEIILNVCLGERFSGGELCFHGVCCEKHVDTPTQPEEAFEYSHIVGHAILYQGRNRHVSRVTTAGKRFNLVLGCKSHAFREMSKHQSVFSWCSGCKQKKKRRMIWDTLSKLDSMMLR